MLENLRALNVLLVEDDLEIQESLKEVLAYFFANVYTANDGEEALKALEEEIVHCIFTDYEMPKLNGLELIKKVRSTNKSIPITIISNHDDREKLQACMPLNLSGYLFKPLRYVNMKEYLETFAIKLLDEGILSYTFSPTHKLNFSNRTLLENGNIHQLTKMEYLFLELLISHAGDIVTTEKIVEHLFQLDPSESTIKNIVYRLKKKYNFNYIENIPQVGYKLINAS